MRHILTKNFYIKRATKENKKFIENKEEILNYPVVNLISGSVRNPYDTEWFKSWELSSIRGYHGRPSDIELFGY